MIRGPYFHISLELGQVLAPRHVSFHQEGEGIVDSSYLSSLADLSLVRFLSTVNNGLPYFFGKALVGAGCV